MGNINRTHGFRGPHGPTPRTSQLAAREGFGPERPSPGAEGSSRPTGRRSRGRPRTAGNREERMGRANPAGTAPVGTMGEPGYLRTRSVPAQVRSNELAAARPFGPGPHQEDPPNPSIDRTRRGILPGAAPVPRGTYSLPSVVPAPLSRPLLLRHPRRT